jgi:hypothetical protein
MAAESYVFKEVMSGFNPDLIISNKPHSLMKGLNLDMEKEPGTLRKRKGYSQFGDQIESGKDVLGMHEFIDSSGDRIPVAAINTSDDANSKIVYFDSTWKDGITSLTAGKKMRFANLINHCFASNGEEIKSSSDGANWGDDNLSGARAANDLVVYQDILFAIGIKGYRSDVLYSNVPSKESWSDPYTLSWSDSNNFTVGLGDGEDLIAGQEYRGSLFLFKNSSITRTIYPIRDNGIRTLSKTIGANSKDCIKVVSGQMIFFCDGFRDTKKGFYSFVSTSDSEPQIISEPVQPYIDGMSSGQEVVAVTVGDLYVAYIGSVTNEACNINLSNCYLVFNAKTNQWLGAWEMMPAKAGGQFTVSGITSAFIGDDDGNTWKLDDGNTDNGKAISFQAESQVYDISQISGRSGYSKRMVRNIWIIGDNLENTSFRYRFDRKVSEKDGWTTVQGMKSPVHVIPVKGIKTNLWQFSFFGISKFANDPLIRKVLIEYE